MKKTIIILLGVLLTACTPSSTTKNKKYINSEGTTLETRILVQKDIKENKVILLISYRHIR